MRALFGGGWYTAGINVESPDLLMQTLEKAGPSKSKASQICIGSRLLLVRVQGLTPVNASLRKDWTLDRPHIYLSGPGPCVPKLKPLWKKRWGKIHTFFPISQADELALQQISHCPSRADTPITPPFTGVHKSPPMLPIRTHDLIFPTQSTRCQWAQSQARTV